MRIGAYLIAVGFFGLLPFVYLESLVDPVLQPQFLLLGAGTLVVLGLLASKLFRPVPERSWSLPKYPLLILGALALLQAISLFQAINLPLGIFEVLTWAMMGILVMVFIRLLQVNPEFYPAILKVLVIATLLQSLVGIFNWLPYASLELDSRFPTGTHANSNLYGLALVYSFPFLVHAILLHKGFWRYASALTLAISLFMIYDSGSRSAVSTIFLSLVVLLVVLLIRASANKQRRKRIILITLPLIMVALYAMGHIWGKKAVSLQFSLMWQEQPVLYPNSPSLDHRMVLWNKSFQMLGEHPVTGVGAGNWKLNIQQYGFNAYGDGGDYGLNVPQRAHNEFLEIANEGGVLALLALVLLFGMAIRQSLRLAFDQDRQIFIRGSLLLNFWIGYLLSCFFNFPLERPFHLLLFAFGLAVTFSGTGRGPSRWKVPGFAVVIPGVVICGALIWFSSFKIGGELKFKEVKQLQQAQEWQALLDASDGYENWYTPVDPETGLPLPWYRSLGAFGTGQLELGLQESKMASEITPFHLGVRVNLAAAFHLNRQFPEAISTYEALLETFPDYHEGRLNLSLSCFEAGQFEQAAQNLKQVQGFRDDQRYIFLQQALGPQYLQE